MGGRGETKGGVVWSIRRQAGREGLRRRARTMRTPQDEREELLTARLDVRLAGAAILDEWGDAGRLTRREAAAVELRDTA